MELWAFTILYGTNRVKMVWEAKSCGMNFAEGEECFSNMPCDEEIFWMRSAHADNTGEMQPFPQPPDNIVKEMRARADICGVNLNSN